MAHIDKNEWMNKHGWVIGYAGFVQILVSVKWYNILLEKIDAKNPDAFFTWVTTPQPNGPGIPIEEAYCLTDYLFHDVASYPGYEKFKNIHSPRW